MKEGCKLQPSCLCALQEHLLLLGEVLFALRARQGIEQRRQAARKLSWFVGGTWRSKVSSSSWSRRSSRWISVRLRLKAVEGAMGTVMAKEVAKESEAAGARRTFR
jgi:hypothetical protein